LCLIYNLVLTPLLISALGFAFLGAVLEPPHNASGVSTYRYLPQDKESFGSDTSHEENA